MTYNNIELLHRRENSKDVIQHKKHVNHKCIDYFFLKRLTMACKFHLKFEVKSIIKLMN